MGKLLLISLGCTLVASLVFIPGLAIRADTDGGGGAADDRSLGAVTDR